MLLRWLEIKQKLKDYIIHGTPGEKLPERNELCRLFDTTRTTLDKAISDLVAEKILTSRKGSGTFISNTVPEITSNNWWVIVPNILEPIYNCLVSGIQFSAERFGANVILCSSEYSLSRQEQFIKRMLRSNAAGTIMVPVVTNNPIEDYRIYTSLLEAQVPLVFCNRPLDGLSVPAVVSNDFYGGYIATKHLITKGYNRIAYITRHKYRTSIDRCQGYLTALIENGFEIDRHLICMSSSEDIILDCTAETERLLSSTDVNAIFCFDDDIAIEVCDTIRRYGKVVSDDIGIIGYNNIKGTCDASIPALTSISYKADEMGQKAGEILQSKICKEQASTGFEYYLYQPEIVIRNSCLGFKSST